MNLIPGLDRSIQDFDLSIKNTVINDNREMNKLLSKVKYNINSDVSIDNVKKSEDHEIIDFRGQALGTHDIDNS